MAGSSTRGRSVAHESQVQMRTGDHGLRKLDNSVECLNILVGSSVALEAPDFRKHPFLNLAPIEVRVPVGVDHPQCGVTVVIGAGKEPVKLTGCASGRPLGATAFVNDLDMNRHQPIVPQFLCS